MTVELMTRLVEAVEGSVEKIPQVIIAKISQPKKVEGGYFFDLYLKLVNGIRGVCQGVFISSEFVEDGLSSEISDIFVDIIKKELYKMKEKKC